MMTTIECDERYGGVLAWSRIDPKPILVHDNQSDSYVACWNGEAFPREVALCIAAKHLLTIYPGGAVAEHLEEQCRKQDMKLNLVRVENAVADAILILRKNTDNRKKVLQWFDKRNAMEI